MYYNKYSNVQVRYAARQRSVPVAAGGAARTGQAVSRLEGVRPQSNQLHAGQQLTRLQLHGRLWAQLSAPTPPRRQVIPHMYTFNLLFVRHLILCILWVRQSRSFR